MKYLSLLLTIFILACSIETSYPTAEWTLMFYLADDYSTLTLTNDILELTYKDVNTSDIRLIILYDGPINGDSSLEILDSPLSSNSRIIDLNSTTIEVDDDGEIDMATEDTLKSFISYVKDKAPANNYALYFGSHGTGFQTDYTSGLAVENGEDNNSSLLTVTEIAKTLEDTGGVNLVTFDACNLGNIETIYEFKNATNYVIASPELIPGPGNDYIGFIEAAYNLTDTSVESLGKATLQAYYDYYDENKTTLNGHEAKSLQQLYNVEKITEIVETESFKTKLSDFKDLKESIDNETEFNSYNYTDIFNLLDDTTELEEGITIAEGGIYKWISVYIPLSNYTYDDYNTDFEETSFAIKFPEWIEILNN